MFSRRLTRACGAAAGCLAVLLCLAPVPPAAADSRPLHDVIAPEWGQGEIVIVRSRWTVNVTGTLTDTRADGDCVYVEAVLEVDDWLDPDQRTPDHCSGPATSQGIDLSLQPDFGSKLSQIRVRVCAADALKDSCLEREYTVPAEQPNQPRLKPKVDRYMAMTMARFNQERAREPGPYNWSADGCTYSPDSPGGYNFKDACNRHDFGYYNYGTGRVKASPTDATRAEVDARFRADMMDVCARYSGDERGECEGFAKAYHGTVRKAGGKWFYS